MLTKRPRCSVYIAISLDGFIARPNGSLDWLSMVQRSGEDYGYGAFFDSIDAIVMGRRTYDTVLGFSSWPYAGKRCLVLTHESPRPRHTETFHSADTTSLLDQLYAEGIRHVYVDGGMVIRSFLDATVVDDLTISIIPLILGQGVALFQDGGVEQRLRLVSSRAFASGLVQINYQRAVAT